MQPSLEALALAVARPRLLLLSMYPLDQGMWGPTVRISHLRDELERIVELDVVAGYRGARRVALVRYALSGRLRRLDGIYVENSSNLPAETDFAFLALARALGIPVLTYVRDAQYLFDEYYSATTMRRRFARSTFLPAIRLLRSVSSWVGYPSRGLAEAVRDPKPEPLLLPPGSPPPAGVSRLPDAGSLLFVGSMKYAVHGLDLLIGSVQRVRDAGHELDVICVSRPGEEPPEPRPEWLRVERGAAEEIHRLLPGVLATIQPRHRSPYNDLGVPIKLMDYLGYGRPIVTTDCIETARIVNDADCGIVTGDDVASLSAGLLQLVTAGEDQIDRWSHNADEAARRWSWAARARQIVTVLRSGRAPIAEV